MDISTSDRLAKGLSNSRIADRVDELLGDARLAREAGEFNQLRALVNAVLALDPNNDEAEALLAGAAQRRQMTLMFCDVVGSTAIADTRDPEELSDLLDEYRRTLTEVIERFGGFIDDHQGDGMLVRFGYPEIHEDDARRAVLSGLAMVHALRESELHIRVAVNTDIVVLDRVGVTGAAAHEASRLQSFAKPDTVVISDATHALVRGYFDVEPMGHVELRGVARAVEVFTVLGERVGGRLEPGASSSPFAGRRTELERIAAAWHAAGEDWQRALEVQDGVTAPALLVIGGAGIGKSRLVAEAARAADAPCTECRCSSYHETTPLHAFRPLLEAVCELSDSDSATERLVKLRTRLGMDPERGPDLPFLAAALQIPAPAMSPPPDVDPSRLRLMALVAAARLVHSQVASGPAMVFVDDLQWADPSTVDLIATLLSAPCPGLLVVLAARDGFEPPWPQADLERLALGPLPGPELEEIALRMPEGTRLTEEQRGELISRSDGVPLFLEELVRTADALDQGRELHRSLRYADYPIPAALRDPLLARLSSPGVDLDLAQVAATIGRDVDRELLRQVAGMSDAVFESRLATLIGAGLVDASPGSAIRFRHELIREAAYETQRRSARRGRHSRVADHLLRSGGASVHGDAGEAAFHLERAHRFDEAIDAHVLAAQAAQSVGAHIEATRQLTQALALQPHLPEGPQRQQTELMVRELRSFSAVMAGGYSAPEAAEDHPRCVELCEELGLRPELLPSLIRGWSYYAFRGSLAEADRLSDTMEHVVATNDLTFPVAGIGKGVTCFFRGRFDEARRLMEGFVAHPWGATEGLPPTEWPLPNDPLAAVCAHLVPTLWISGERRAAYASGDRALQRAADLRFPYGPFSLGYVKSQLAMTRRLEGDHEAAALLAGEMLELGERHGFVLWSFAGTLQAGISRIHAGDHSSLGELVDHVAGWRRMLIAEVWTPFWLTELAVVQRIAGHDEAAAHSLDEALAVAEETGSDFYSAETLRIRGEMRHQRGDAGGLSDLRAALQRAREQTACAFELRAATSLMSATEGTSEARQALATAIARFPDDAGYHELEEARSLVAS